MNIDEIRESFVRDIGEVSTLPALYEVKSRYIGRKGKISFLFKNLKGLPPERRKEEGRLLNELKGWIEERIREKEKEIRAAEAHRRELEGRIDFTLPGRRIRIGNIHPLNIVLREIIEIFSSMGFSLEEGPEVELDYYNFEALNIPKDHPARDMHDTFYITEGALLRTHTSPVQIRVMKEKKPPLRVISAGKVYRRDLDPTHSPMFHQVEGLLVDEDVKLADLKGVLSEFANRIFGGKRRTRFRPSYFPFTEPSLEVDVECVRCGGEGCSVCKGTGWLEILGAGMVHPEVFKAVGYDSGKYVGFAFGLGVERITMLKYGIDDLRLFFENDLRFLRQF
ncbi:MAG: phenylalanine--tRNA ligase subunit alpha [Synergistetes bacterium]|nr:phenylalanine--tRNA ligase subunit alpha [Synergistota bacterium]